MLNFLKILLFLVIVVGIAAYFLSRAPSMFQSFPQEKILSPTSPSISKSPAVSSAPTQISSSTEISSQIPDYLIPSGLTRAQLSPYFQKVRISSAFASNYSTYSSQINLYAYLSNSEKINVTGWRIKTNHGEFIIPQAVNIYDFSGFSFEQDIVISGNANIYLYSTRSPINLNFRLNKCAGYLQNNYSFNPALTRNCPTPQRSEIYYLSGQCQSYILSLGSCEVPSISFSNSLSGTDEGNACRQFLSTVNQYTCYQKHHWETDFLSNEWRIWTNWTNFNGLLDPQHDTVRLFDTQGLLVDQYIY